MAASPSGKDKIVRWARIFVGAYDLSGDARTFSSCDSEFSEAETTGWSEGIHTFLTSGQRMAGVRGYQALLNDAAGRSYAALAQSTGTQNTFPVTLMFGGGNAPAVPDPAYLMDGVQLSDAVTFDGGVAVITTDMLPRSAGQVGNPMGIVLANQALTTTVSLGSHDNGAASSSGWLANIHVTVSSGGEWAFVLQHSTDDTSFSTLGTFTVDGSIVEAESLSGTGTVNRYVRLTATRTSGTCTIACAYSRN